MRIWGGRDTSSVSGLVYFRGEGGGCDLRWKRGLRVLGAAFNNFPKSFGSHNPPRDLNQTHTPQPQFLLKPPHLTHTP